MPITVKHNQTLADVAVMHLNNAELLFDIAAVNGVDVDDLVPGFELQLPNVIVQPRLNQLVQSIANTLVTVVAVANQTLADVAVMHLNNAELLFDIAETNSIDVDDLISGQKLVLPAIIAAPAKTTLTQIASLLVKRAKILNRQTLADLVIHKIGNADWLFDVAEANGVDVDDLTEGTELTLPVNAIVNEKITNLFSITIPAGRLSDDANEVTADEWTLYYTTGLPATHG